MEFSDGGVKTEWASPPTLSGGSASPLCILLLSLEEAAGTHCRGSRGPVLGVRPKMDTPALDGKQAKSAEARRCFRYQARVGKDTVK